jgi:hypothetical protein
MSWRQKILFPSWTASSSPERTWLHLGFRLSLVALGLSIALGVHKPYTFIPLGVMLVFFLVDLPFAERDKRVGRARHGDTVREA